MFLWFPPPTEASWYNARKARRAVVPFIINITMEINFSSKVYSKSLPKGSPLYPPYGTMQVKRGDLWYHYICKKTWFRQPCKHNGSYRGNI